MFALRSRIAVTLFVTLTACTAHTRSTAIVGADDGTSRAGESSLPDLPVGATVQATANVNLRDGASTSNDILDVIPNGDSATVVEASAVDGFYHVRWNGEDGFSSGRYLRLVDGGATGGGGSTGGSSGADPGASPSGAPAPGGAPWTCSGSYATTPVDSGSYYLTEFGCWVDGAGAAHGDPGDNCIPGCLSQAHAAGLCAAGSSGKSCEQSVNYYIADAGRFGCLTRVRVRNPANGKSVIAVTLDYGPACWVEQEVSHGLVDASAPVNRWLFGSDMGVSDRAPITIEIVDGSTPLGPE